MRNEFVTTFDFGNPGHKMLREWSAITRQRIGTSLYAAGSWRHSARQYALDHGESKVLCADGSVIRFSRDETGGVHQRTYRKVYVAD